MPAPSLHDRLQQLDWARIEQALDQDGCARLEGLLTPAQCQALSRLYQSPELFRSKVIMPAMVLAVASTSILAIRCRSPWRNCASCSTRAWWTRPTAGTA